MSQSQVTLIIEEVMVKPSGNSVVTGGGDRVGHRCGLLDRSLHVWTLEEIMK